MSQGLFSGFAGTSVGFQNGIRPVSIPHGNTRELASFNVGDETPGGLFRNFRRALENWLTGRGLDPPLGDWAEALSLART